MEQNEFKKRLSEVAEWTQEIKGPSGQASRRKTKPKDDWDEDEYEVEEVLTDPDALNIPIELKKVKPITSVCEDCGVVVENRRKHYKLSDNRFGKQWRETCYTCKKQKNPFNGKFELTSNEAVVVWRQYLEQNNQK